LISPLNPASHPYGADGHQTVAPSVLPGGIASTAPAEAARRIDRRASTVILNKRLYPVSEGSKIGRVSKRPILTFPYVKATTSTVALVKSMFHANRTKAYLSDSRIVSEGKNP